MKIITKKDDLKKVLQPIVPFITEKGLHHTSLGIVSSGSQVIFSYYGESSGIGVWSSLNSPCDGALSKCIDANIFPKVIDAFPDEDIEITFNEEKAIIQNLDKKHKVSLRYIDNVPESEPSSNTGISVPGKSLKNALKISSPFVSKSIVNPVYMMVHLILENNNIKYYSTDGHARLIYGIEPSEILQNMDLYIPGNVAEKIGKSNDEMPVHISLLENFMVFRYPSLTLKVLPYVGKFPDRVKEYISCQTIDICSLNVSSLAHSLDILTVLSGEYVETHYKDMVKISIENDNVTTSLVNNEETKFVVGTRIDSFEPLQFNRSLVSEFLSICSPSDTLLISKLNMDTTFPPYKFYTKERNFAMILTEMK